MEEHNKQLLSTKLKQVEAVRNERNNHMDTLERKIDSLAAAFASSGLHAEEEAEVARVQVMIDSLKQDLAQLREDQMSAMLSSREDLDARLDEFALSLKRETDAIRDDHRESEAQQELNVVRLTREIQNAQRQEQAICSLEQEPALTELQVCQVTGSRVTKQLQQRSFMTGVILRAEGN